MNDAEATDPLLKFAEEVICDCPLDHTNPTDCPLHELRAKSVPDRRRFIRALPREALEQLAVYHWVCLEARILRGSGSI